MGRKSSANVLSRFLSQPAEYGLKAHIFVKRAIQLDEIIRKALLT